MTVAEEMLGSVFCRQQGDQVLRATVLETEAYVGRHDAASHARVGMTKRNAVMFGPPGFLYVFAVYGVHNCVNVVVEPEGVPCAVLIRAVHLRGETPRRVDGPGRVSRTLGIDRTHNGAAVDGPDFWFETGPTPRRIDRTPRIGVGYAGIWAEKHLRFVIPRGFES